MPIVTVIGQDGHLLKVNGIDRGAMAVAGIPVPVDVGWATFEAFATDGTLHRDADIQINPDDNDPVDLT
ncbi:MAG: hypothetical protein VW999_08415 [Alphaproteobacteria bacterium]